VLLKERTRTTMLLSIQDEQNESMEDNDEEDERESRLPVLEKI
jgi:hypothetical protein